jgi:hypothetical protein
MAKGIPIKESLIKAANFTKKAIEKGEYGTLNQFWKLKRDII